MKFDFRFSAIRCRQRKWFESRGLVDGLTFVAILYDKLTWRYKRARTHHNSGRCLRTESTQLRNQRFGGVDVIVQTEKQHDVRIEMPQMADKLESKPKIVRFNYRRRFYYVRYMHHNTSHSISYRHRNGCGFFHHTNASPRHTNVNGMTFESENEKKCVCFFFFGKYKIQPQ